MTDKSAPGVQRPGALRRRKMQCESKAGGLLHYDGPVNAGLTTGAGLITAPYGDRLGFSVVTRRRRGCPETAPVPCSLTLRPYGHRSQ